MLYCVYKFENKQSQYIVGSEMYRKYRANQQTKPGKW